MYASPGSAIRSRPARAAQTRVGARWRLVTVALAAVVLTGCASVPAETNEGPDASVLGDDFFVGEPTPEATISPAEGSWEAALPPEGYSVALIAKSDDPAASTLVSAAQEWATARSVDLTVLPAASDDEVEDLLVQATDTSPDLIVGAGAGVVDVFALITSQFLDQPFLVVGAQLPEPTENVTSVIWPGANFRGTAISDEQDLSAVTDERGVDAMAAGVANVLHGVPGIVLSMP
jgi:hypothetical protein